MRLPICPAASILALTITGPAMAQSTESITVEFTGTVTAVQGITGLQAGDPITGQYRFDPSAPDIDQADKNLGLYEAVTDFTIQLGQYDYSASRGLIAVSNDALPQRGLDAPVDGYSVTIPLEVEEAKLAQWAPVQVEINLADTSATAFEGDALPETPSEKPFDIRGPEGYRPAGGTIHFGDTAAGVGGVVRFRVQRLETVSRVR